MELEFKLEEADLVALAKHHMQHSPTTLRRYRLQRYGLLIVLSFLAFLSHFALQKTAVALYLAALAIFCFGLYPFYYRWLVGRTLQQIVAARLNPAVFAPRTLRLRAEGLEHVTAGKQTLTPWSRIGPVTVTAEHAFVAIDGAYGLVIPRSQVREELFQSIVEALRAGRS